MSESNNHCFAAGLRGFKLSLALILGATLGLFGLVSANAQTPTAEQLKIFNNLDPSTQQAVLQSMGQGTNNSATSATSSNSSTVDPRRRAKQQSGKTDQNDNPAEMALKPDDTVLINIDFPRPKSTIVPASNGQPAQVVTVPVPESDKPLKPEEKKKLEDENIAGKPLQVQRLLERYGPRKPGTPAKQPL